MPERAFLTETWDDDWFQELDRDQRYLFIYLWTNNHVKQAGVYQVTLATIAFETKFPKEELGELLLSLTPKVEWYPEQNYIWVRNFIKRQYKSPKFLIAAANCLKTIKNDGLVQAVLDYNKREHSISIPYEYDIDSVGILPSPSPSPDTKPGSSPKELGVVKGEGEPQTTLDEEKVELLRLIRGLKHWRTTPDDEEWLLRFLQEFPEFSREMMTACTDYYSDRPDAKHKGDWKNRLRNWLIKQRQFALERRQHGQTKGERVTGSRPASDFRGKW